MVADWVMGTWAFVPDSTKFGPTLTKAGQHRPENGKTFGQVAPGEWILPRPDIYCQLTCAAA